MSEPVEKVRATGLSVLASVSRGYVQKKTLTDHEDLNGEPRVGYDLSGLILALESSPVEVKSRNLQRRIDALPRD